MQARCPLTGLSGDEGEGDEEPSRDDLPGDTQVDSKCLSALIRGDQTFCAAERGVASTYSATWKESRECATGEHMKLMLASWVRRAVGGLH